MKYDFTAIIDRGGMDAIALEEIPFADASVRDGFDRIPMWVADMNFATVPTIQEHMARRIAHPLFGYFAPREEYYEAILRWQRDHNHVTNLAKEAIGYENGVIGCLSSALQAFTAPGEAVFLHSPTYIGFTGALEENGRRLAASPLVKDEEGIWRMDYADMDRVIKENHIHFAIFCSPHNPCGRVWEREEIEKAMEIFHENNCCVFSDEIWSDLVLNGHRHIPTQSVSEDAKMRTIAAYAPSKTFNLAGLVGAYHIIYNPYLRDRLEKQARLSHYNEMNVLSMHALIGAYEPEGYAWLEELKEILSGNINWACDYIAENFEGVKVSRPQGTYMLFLDCREWLEAHHMTQDELMRAGIAVGVIWQDGRMFRQDGAIRMNLALPRSRMEEAFRRLKEYVFV
jgi:cysteine-S-conjugate beta-lyase